MLSVLNILSRLVPSKNSSDDVSSSEDVSDGVSSSYDGSSFNEDNDSHAEVPIRQDFSDESDGFDETDDVDGWDDSSDSQYREFAEDSFVSGADLREQMEAEKQMYPGASTWAKPEEELFEALFLRQDRALLPSHWNLDFRGMPMSAHIFETSHESPPLVYTHSDKDFHGTKALTRLIDLTAAVRTTVQCGFRPKAPMLIKKSLEGFINWAARDGGFSHLRYIPNIMIWIVPRQMDHDGMDSFMQTRMRSLALLQREYLRNDRSPDFWRATASPFLGLRRALGTSYRTKSKQHTPTPHKRSAKEAGLSKRGTALDDSTTTSEDELSGERTTHDSKRQRLSSVVDGSNKTPRHGHRLTDTSNQSGSTLPGRPKTPLKVKYRRQPPVVYGLFVVGTSVFLLTLDSSKGDEGYVSFHLEMNFLDSHQSVWNGLTLAIAVCLARDDLMTRTDDFEALPVESESDPDA